MEQKKDRTWFYVINGIILVLLMIFILQNRQMITIKYLGLNIDGPAFFVYVILFGIGFFAGWLWYYFHRSKKEKLSAKERRDAIEASKVDQ